MNFFSLDQLLPTPWKNGGGMTREILSWPLGADFTNFDWRVSVASIAVSGSFSKFAGVDRVIMLLDGDGVKLRGAKTNWHLDRPATPFTFSGDEELSCELLGAESTDFNVMTRRSVAFARVEILDASSKITSHDGGLVMCLSGSWSVDFHPVTRGQGCWWVERASEVRIDKTTEHPAALVLVRWTRLTAHA